MYRPTSEYNITPNDNFYFTIPTAMDKNEIIQVIYEAHLNGYTSTVYGKPHISNVEEAINRRFISFSQTNSLHFGTIINLCCIAETNHFCRSSLCKEHNCSMLLSTEKFGKVHLLL